MSNDILHDLKESHLKIKILIEKLTVELPESSAHLQETKFMLIEETHKILELCNLIGH